jgi:hypothetical protein
MHRYNENALLIKGLEILASKDRTHEIKEAVFYPSYNMKY